MASHATCLTALSALDTLGLTLGGTALGLNLGCSLLHERLASFLQLSMPDCSIAVQLQ